MKTQAVHRYIRVSPRKCRLVVDQVRGLAIGDALNRLDFSRKRAASLVAKALRSAIANAENNYGADIDELKVIEAAVDEGPVFKRYRARARGRASDIKKRTSHVKIVIGDNRE